MSGDQCSQVLSCPYFIWKLQDKRLKQSYDQYQHYNTIDDLRMRTLSQMLQFKWYENHDAWKFHQRSNETIKATKHSSVIHSKNLRGEQFLSYTDSKKGAYEQEFNEQMKFYIATIKNFILI